MTFVDTLRQWDEALTCADRQDLSGALGIFKSIKEPNSKIYFDVGCLHLLNQDLDAAEKAFDCSIRKDEHLAVAFFQRGITFYRKKKFEESLADFHRAYKALRGNQLIDYKTLGLRYILYACEVLHNAALAEARLGNWEEAQKHLVKALDYKTEAKLNVIDRALQSTLKQKLFQLVMFPSKILFRPKKSYVAELEKKDYLGKAKVVASVIPQDEFSGFAPLQPQVEDGPTSPREPEVLRALEGEPHTVLFEFLPETSDELAVVPGNIVFVLQKGADNWAYVVFNERRGLVPYNYLERLEISPASQQNRVNQPNEETPPTREAPTRPERIQGLTPGTGDAQRAEPAETSCVVKVRFTFTVAVCVPRGATFDILVGKIGRKLKVPVAAVTLKVEAEGQSLGDSDMDDLWSRARGGRLTVWCHITEPSKKTLQDGISVMALHSYHSNNPEDLNFDQGESIIVLSRVNQEWLEGRCNGSTGIFPASFVDVVPLNGQ